jgi:carbon-monoxide dehydrogenase medium subunit
MEDSMAIVQEFKYFKPKSIKEAVSLLSQHKNAAVLAGGTDLVCNLKDGIVSPKAVVDIKGIASLNGITFKGKRLKIGALVTFSDLIKSEIIKDHFPLIGEMARAVASVAIRNRATVVGNICSAVPCMDSAPVLSVYDAEINLTGPEGERRIPISQWFKGNRKTSIKKSEMVTSIIITLPAKTHAGCFVKLGRYKGEDLAQANLAVLAFSNHQYRVAFGSVAAIPIRAKRIEKALNGNPLEKNLIKAAQELIPQEISPITDIRASKEYRMHMCKVMFERAIKAAAERLEGAGPGYGTALI